MALFQKKFNLNAGKAIPAMGTQNRYYCYNNHMCSQMLNLILGLTTSPDLLLLSET